MNIFSRICFSIIILVGINGYAAAEECDKPCLVDKAKPYLKLSCAQLLDAADGEERIAKEIIISLLALSAVNRDIDLSLLLKSDKDRANFRTSIADKIRQTCEQDINSLLVYVVDNAVVSTLSEK